MFERAERKKSKLRLLLDGVSGSGKTYSSLLLASQLASQLGGKVAVLDTENGSASLYADKFNFDVVNLRAPYTPERYIEVIREAEKLGYGVLVIDSITHEWNGSGGCLEIVEKMPGANSYTKWGKVTPRHNALINTILSSSMHIIATSRAKSDYEMVDDNGRKSYKKVGLKAEQREGTDYEFTTVLRLDGGGNFSCSKDRTGLFLDRFEKLSASHAREIINWLNTGADVKHESITETIEDRLYSCLTIEELRAYYGSLSKEEQAKYKSICVDIADKFKSMEGVENE